MGRTSLTRRRLVRPTQTSCKVSSYVTTGADNTNNVLALAFGLLIVFLVIAGSLWIMANLNHNMVSMDQLMQMQR